MRNKIKFYRVMAVAVAASLMAGMAASPVAASQSFFGEDAYEEDGFFDDTTLDAADDMEDGFFTDGYQTDAAPDAVVDETGETELSASDGSISVTVTGSNGSMDMAESLSVQEVEKDNAEKLLPDYEVLSVYDIALNDSDGNEIEPDGLVDVTISGDIIQRYSGKGNHLSVVHLVEGRTGLFSWGRKAVSTEEMDVEVLSEDTICFTTSSFSEYALVLTGNDSQKEIALSGEQYFELDKYLSAPTGTTNGQNTYDVYLEQAYYDGTQPHVVENNAPEGQDVIIVLDQSASMHSGTRVESMNDGTKAFLQSMALLNQQRLRKAKAGFYTDIDPDGDVEAQMQDHYMRITGIIGFNNRIYSKYRNASGFAVMSSADVNTLASAAHIKNDYMEYVAALRRGESGSNYDLQDMTRTDLAMTRAKSYINTANYGNTIVLLLTDGAPFGYGAEAKLDYSYKSSAYVSMSAQNANSALKTAREIKDNGAKIYSVYLAYPSVSDLTAAFSTGDIRFVPCNSSNPSEHIVSIFLSLMASDYPKNGGLGYSTRAQGEITYPFDYTYEYDNRDPRNRFGKYIRMSEELSDLPSDLEQLPGNIDIDSSKNKRGYAGRTAIVHDEISEPFEVSDALGIKVYEVPRIPANLDADGIPTDADDDGIVSDFRWGEQDEWIDITDDPEIAITVNGNIVEVTGYDYEYNAVTDYDKDLYSTRPVADAAVYHPGDYGYKLVVSIPINSKVTFGGVGIETNNSDTSAFYPAEPVGYQTYDPDGEDYLPIWTNNMELNPDGNAYIEKYPVPQVDLAINYKVPYDSIRIYAPQTARLDNLVTDTNGMFWYVDSDYSGLKQLRDNAYSDYLAASMEYTEAMEAVKKNPDDAEKMATLAEALAKSNDAKAVYDEAQKEFEAAESYIPDGRNNAFVNISYVLKDPEGAVAGTMEIPYGVGYRVESDGSANLHWNFTGGKDAIITKSGVYTIECTVTPVDTVRAPGGHIHTNLDTDAVQETVPYGSDEYSPTGSSAGNPKIITEHPEAYIFQLHVTGVDTKLRPSQAVDFFEGNEKLSETANPHVTDMEWVCTDGVTRSNPEDEPGITGSLMVGGSVTLTAQIPDGAVADGRVKDVMGTTTVNVDDGDYVPVAMLLSRETGSINKTDARDVQVKQSRVYMTSNDGIYNGVSSVVWDHECSIVDGCDNSEFSQAQKYSTPEDETGKGAVRALIHVGDEPVPDIGKQTDTPGITKGEDIKWTVSLKNDNEVKNEGHHQTKSTMVDILPYVGDGRIDPNTNNEGSQFGGSLYYKEIKVDYSGSAKALEAFKNGTAKMYYTTDVSVRNADEGQILGGVENSIGWQELTGSVSGTTVIFTGCPDTATAIRLDTVIDWKESVVVNLTANIKNPDDQAAGDRYHNQASVMNGNGVYNSEVVVTTVTSLYISGTVWEDSDANGLMDGNEARMSDITVTLYEPFNPLNPGTPDRTVNGVQLQRAYDTEGNMIAPFLTSEDGTYLFDDLHDGTYYIICDRIPEKYNMTKKQAGAGDVNASRIDSEAEEEILPATGDAEKELAKSAWITAVTVTGSGVPNENFGLKLLQGKVRVGKTLDQIYYPASMTDGDKEDYNVSFLFRLENTATGDAYTRWLYLDENTMAGKNGQPQVWVEFRDLPLGTYRLTEIRNAQYDIKNVTSGNTGVKYNAATKAVTIPITEKEHDVEVQIENTLKKDPPGGDLNGVENAVGGRTPVSLEVTYVGAPVISDSTATEYTFVYSDFDPAKGGDIVVTYDNGETISLSAGTLDFSQLTLSPATVTNMQNTNNNDRIPVTVYYTEKGVTVSDSFRVGVDLMPIHKFRITFDANGGVFDDGGTRNIVMFGYDNIKGSNYVTSGIYKDVNNGMLVAPQ